MKRIDSSFQCCIRDGSRPAAYVMQLRYANHLKVLYSKDMVLNVQAKGSVRHYQVRVKKLNANEPLMTCRKRNLVGKTVGFFALTGRHCNGQLFTGYRPTGIKTAGALHRLLYET
jgi:hypothetical protein